MQKVALVTTEYLLCFSPLGNCNSSSGQVLFISSAVKQLLFNSGPPKEPREVKCSYDSHHNTSFQLQQKQSTRFTSICTDPLTWLSAKDHLKPPFSFCQPPSWCFFYSVPIHTKHFSCYLWTSAQVLVISIQVFTAKTYSTYYLQCTTSCNSLICIQSRTDFFAKKFTDLLFNSRDSCCATNYFYCINILLL